jgi:peptidoglycan hydrolase-like protein with peptidoglycan-binding domain
VKRILPQLSRTLGALRFGMSGDEVKRLQQLLGMKPALQTGYFGVITEGAVMSFQGLHGLVQDGVVGPKTRAAIGL